MAGTKYSLETHKYIALDYDGTLVQEGIYPEVGKFKLLAITTVKRMVEEGYKISIWTARGGKEQEDLVLGALLSAGVDIEKIIFNSHFDYFLDKYESASPKIYADVYIDDRAYGIKEIDWVMIHLDFFGNFNYEALDELKTHGFSGIVGKVANKLNDLLTKA